MTYILVTGGAGFIGSHTVFELISNGYIPVVIDNFSNSAKSYDTRAESIKRVEDMKGRAIKFYETDLLDLFDLEKIFKKYSFSCVIHFAGLKAVNESKEIPLKYYSVNVGGTLNLLNTMEKFKVKNIIFSSSATVYGEPKYLPLDEKHPVGNCTNAYGKSKYFIEEILKDMSEADKSWNIVTLRYFNPVGAHESGKIGEDPLDVPNNLMPYISKTAIGIFPFLSVFGNDYPTPDGTGVRDYIHVVDLAQGHVAALKMVEKGCGHRVYNLGQGKGYSVLDLVHAFEKASGRKIPYQFKERRAGDVASCYADPSLAYAEMGWKATRGLDAMCQDTWKFQESHPKGLFTEPCEIWYP